MKYIVIGAPKCGTQSTEKHLTNQGHEVIRKELMYLENGLEQYENLYSDYTPVIVTRIPECRQWSLYHFKEYDKEMSFEEFRDKKFTTGLNFGLDTARSCSDYQKYIDVWKKHGVIVYKLSEISKEKDFPKMNKNMNYTHEVL